MNKHKEGNKEVKVAGTLCGDGTAFKDEGWKGRVASNEVTGRLNSANVPGMFWVPEQGPDCRKECELASLGMTSASGGPSRLDISEK